MFNQDFKDAIERNMTEICNLTNDVICYVGSNDFNAATVSMAMLVGACTNTQALLAAKITYEIERRITKTLDETARTKDDDKQ